MSEQAANTITAPAAATAIPPTAKSTSVPRQLSARLPDPEKFSGNRKDLRRFVGQIQEHVQLNRDRLPTPASRMGYVINRLDGTPYKQANSGLFSANT